MTRIDFRLCLALLFFASPLRASWVVISEIHYHPPEGEALEFVEIYTRDPPRVELSGWKLEGEVRFEFARGAMLLPGEALVVARDPAALKARNLSLTRVLGPFEGRLDNKGGTIRLRNAAGAVECEVPYGNKGRWPAAADGTGHSLTLIDPLLDPRQPSSWTHSAEPGGSPGTTPFASWAREPGKLLVRSGEEWRFLRGKEEPPESWRELEFDDSSWESGPSGFGFADGDDATEIDDMQGQYLALYTRKTISIDDPSKLGHLRLLVNFDDGFLAAINGVEVARANLGPAGSRVTREMRADAKHEAGSATEYDLGDAAKLLRSGKNALAVEVHNESLQSTDVSLIVELEAFTPAPRATAAEDAPAQLRLNEVGADPPFVEVFNPTPVDVALDGFFITDDARDLRKVVVPPGARIGAHGFAVIGKDTLQETLKLGGPDVFLALVRPDGRHVVDALRLDTADSKALSRGRLPDGSSGAELLDPPTPGAPNRIAARSPLVVNEIHYHPLSGNAEEEFIELRNLGTETVALDGFKLRGAVRFDFPAGLAIEPAGFLVVAKAPGVLAGKHGLPAATVAGPFDGKLSGSGETIRLVDPRGVTVERVAYGDRDPWPRAADGLGSSLERIDPRLDGSLAGAWAASDERSRAEWRTIQYEGTYSPAGGAVIPELDFLLLGEGECLIDDVQIKTTGGGARLLPTVFKEDFERKAAAWRAEGTHEGSSAVKDPSGKSERCYRILASGRGNTRDNFVLVPLKRALEFGQRYEVSFRALWQSGTPSLLTRLGGNALAKAHQLAVPDRCGTPGARNSVLAAGGAPPVVGTPLQQPIAPGEADPVSVSVKVSSIDPMASVAIIYRRDGETSWLVAPASDGGNGLWSARIPPVAKGIVEFYVKAEDVKGRAGKYPIDAPKRTALYAVGLEPAPRLPTYTLLAAKREWEGIRSGLRLSNRLSDGTFIAGGSRIFYNVAFRARGSPWTRHLQHNWKINFGAETLDGRRTLVLDRQGGGGKPAERIAYWLMEALHAPCVRQRYVRFNIPGREGGICEDVEEIGAGFLARWFGENREAFQLYKVDDFIEMADSENMRVRVSAALRLQSADPETYRWNFIPRGKGPEDFGQLRKLLEVLDPARTDDDALLEKLDGIADADEWIRVSAARCLMGDWDTLGRHAGKNASLYLAPGAGRWLLLPWDCDQSVERYPPTDPILSPEHPAFVRLLMQPRYRRLYLGYLAYLGEKRLDPARFKEVLGELQGQLGLTVEGIEKFLRARRAFVLGQIPKIPFKVVELERLAGGSEPNRVRVRGTGPVIVQRARLAGREAALNAISLEEWSADFEAGPAGGEALLEALDFGGDVVASERVMVPPR